ncbi:phosphatase 2C-like domain-containing protein [Gilbertella persicaria]|uniref:phosphatase 2C-like domain-containing protein n=1 Tax=Gilbertella persicaria TaxID=101096 RepID=UPI002220973B|nr:phosphatase 2C-like domain-containing protein [Gilbertella persicaria]KAI8059954.1 phosphatase 2C-like domain-containing protein [Gilbertella persicaria]
MFNSPRLFVVKTHFRQCRFQSTCSMPIEYTKPLPMFDFFAQSKPKPSFKLGHGAAGFAKRRQKSISVHTFNSYTSMGAQVGEDAYFRRSDAIGVADGIGGWSETAGSDSALYSTQLMHFANLEMDRFEDIEDPLFFEYNHAHPMDILQRSYDKSLVAAKKNNILGSTTACIAVLRHDELRVANIGDCGISIIRNHHYLFRSEEQQHAFNFPYQLGMRSRDQPAHAQSFNIKVQKNDVIIMGTDGLFDNLFDQHILRLVRDHVDAYTIPGTAARPPRIRHHLEPQLLADVLANAAKEVSEAKRSVDTPFQRRAMEEGFLIEGGKADDISVIVAVVNDCEDSPDRRI